MRTPRVEHKANSEKAALIVIDVQNGLFRKPTPIYGAEALLRNINALTDRAHRARVPVFFVQHSDKKNLVEGSDNWQIHPDLRPLKTDRIVPKLHASAFEKTELQNELKLRDVGSLVVTGLISFACVRAACLDALRRHYRVILVSDGHSSYGRNAPQVIGDWNKRLQARGAELMTTAEIKFGNERII